MAADENSPDERLLQEVLGAEAGRLDCFDGLQLAGVIWLCRRRRNLSEAGRALFASFRQKKATFNDADRLRKYLAKFNLTWEKIRPPG